MLHVTRVGIDAYHLLLGLASLDASMVVLGMLDCLRVRKICTLIMGVWLAADDRVEVGLLCESIQVVQQI